MSTITRVLHLCVSKLESPLYVEQVAGLPLMHERVV